jgi:hypothetical protein
MPITTTGSSVEYNVRALHMAKTNAPEDTVSIAFAVADEGSSARNTSTRRVCRR